MVCLPASIWLLDKERSYEEKTFQNPTNAFLRLRLSGNFSHNLDDFQTGQIFLDSANPFQISTKSKGKFEFEGTLYHFIFHEIDNYDPNDI